MICMCTILVLNSFVNLKRCWSKEFGIYVHVFPKVIDIIEIIDTTYQESFLTILPTHNKTQQHKNLVKFTKLREKNSQENLVKFTKDQTWILSESWNFKSHVS